MKSNIYNTISAIDSLLVGYDGYRVEIHKDNKTYATHKAVVEKEEYKSDTWAVGFQITSE